MEVDALLNTFIDRLVLFCVRQAVSIIQMLFVQVMLNVVSAGAIL